MRSADSPNRPAPTSSAGLARGPDSALASRWRVDETLQLKGRGIAGVWSVYPGTGSQHDTRAPDCRSLDRHSEPPESGDLIREPHGSSRIALSVIDSEGSRPGTVPVANETDPVPHRFRWNRGFAGRRQEKLRSTAALHSSTHPPYNSFNLVRIWFL